MVTNCSAAKCMQLLDCSITRRWMSAPLAPCPRPHLTVSKWFSLSSSHSSQHSPVTGPRKVKLLWAVWQEQHEISCFACGAQAGVFVVWAMQGSCQVQVSTPSTWCPQEPPGRTAFPVLPRGASHSSDIVYVLQKPSMLLHATSSAKPIGEVIQTFGFCHTDGLTNSGVHCAVGDGENHPKGLQSATLQRPLGHANSSGLCCPHRSMS